MLVITVGLAITAYGYITGLFEQQKLKIELSDISCASGSQNYYITLRNVDFFENVSIRDVQVRLDEVPISQAALIWDWVPGVVAGSQVITADNSTVLRFVCSNAGAQGLPSCVPGTTHRVKVIAPGSRTMGDTVSCG